MKELIKEPAIIALLIAASIIYFFLALRFSSHKKNASIIEQCVVVVMVWMLSGITLPPFPYLQPSALAGFNKTLGSAIAQIAIYIFLLVFARQGFRTFFWNVAQSFTRCLPLGLLCLEGLLSSFWSETPLITLRYSLVVLTVSAFAAHLATRYTFLSFARTLRWSMTPIILISILVAIAVPSIGVQGKGWQGVTDHPIGLGCLAALVAMSWCFYALVEPKRKFTPLLLIATTLVPLILSNSATGILLLFTLLSLLLWIKLIDRMSIQKTVITLVFFLIVMVIATVVLKSASDAIFSALGKDPSLSGRADFWPQLIEKIQGHPIVGYGMGGFWQPWRGDQNPANGILKSDGFVPPHAHNGFLEVGLQLGLIGIILFGVLFVSSWLQALRHLITHRSLESGLPLMFMTYITLFNLSSSALLDAGYVWFIYVFTAVRLSLPTRRTVKPLSEDRHFLTYHTSKA